MPTRDSLTYPRLTVRQSGRWGVWATTARVSIRYHAKDRDHLLIISPDFRRAHAAAQHMIARFQLAERRTQGDPR